MAHDILNENQKFKIRINRQEVQRWIDDYKRFKRVLKAGSELTKSFVRPHPIAKF